MMLYYKSTAFNILIIVIVIVDSSLAFVCGRKNNIFKEFTITIINSYSTKVVVASICSSTS
jgi:hypothetical protein